MLDAGDGSGRRVQWRMVRQSRCLLPRPLASKKPHSGVLKISHLSSRHLVAQADPLTPIIMRRRFQNGSLDWPKFTHSPSLAKEANVGNGSKTVAAALGGKLRFRHLRSSPMKAAFALIAAMALQPAARMRATTLRTKRSRRRTARLGRCCLTEIVARQPASLPEVSIADGEKTPSGKGNVFIADTAGPRPRNGVGRGRTCHGLDRNTC